MDTSVPKPRRNLFSCVFLQGWGRLWIHKLQSYGHFCSRYRCPPADFCSCAPRSARQVVTLWTPPPPLLQVQERDQFKKNIRIFLESFPKLNFSWNDQGRYRKTVFLGNQNSWDNRKSPHISGVLFTTQETYQYWRPQFEFCTVRCI